MNPKEIRLGPLVALAGFCGLVAAAVSLALVRGGSLVPQPPWLHAVLLVVIAALVLWFARPVRRHLAGSATSVGTGEALKAARAVVLAQASAVLGAIGVGAYAGALFVALSDWELVANHGRALRLAVHALLAAGLVIAALIAQSWCRVPPPPES